MTLRKLTLHDISISAFDFTSGHVRKLQRLGIINDKDMMEAVETGCAARWRQRYEEAKTLALLIRYPGTRRGPVTLTEIAAVMRRQS